MISNGCITVNGSRKLGFSYTGRYETTQENPKNEVLFLFHGTPGSRVFDFGLGSLFYDKNISVVCPERPGYGLSDASSERTIINWARDVCEVADYLKIEKFHVAGGSGGGPYALACGHVLKDKVKTVLLISSIVPTSTPNFYNGMAWGNKISFFLAKNAPFLLKMAFKSYAKVASKSPDELISKIAKQGGKTDEQFFDSISSSNPSKQILIDHIQQAFKQGHIGIYHDAILLAKDWGFDYKKIDAQIYLWHGTEDKFIPLAPVATFAKTLPHVILRFVEGGGHTLINDIMVANEIAEVINRDE